MHSVAHATTTTKNTQNAFKHTYRSRATINLGPNTHLINSDHSIGLDMMFSVKWLSFLLTLTYLMWILQKWAKASSRPTAFYIGLIPIFLLHPYINLLDWLLDNFIILNWLISENIGLYIAKNNVTFIKHAYIFF